MEAPPLCVRGINRQRLSPLDADAVKLCELLLRCDDMRCARERTTDSRWPSWRTLSSAVIGSDIESSRGKPLPRPGRQRQKDDVCYVIG